MSSLSKIIDWVAGRKRTTRLSSTSRMFVHQEGETEANYLDPTALLLPRVWSTASAGSTDISYAATTLLTLSVTAPCDGLVLLYGQVVVDIQPATSPAAGWRGVDVWIRKNYSDAQLASFGSVLIDVIGNTAIENSHTHNIPTGAKATTTNAGHNHLWPVFTTVSSASSHNHDIAQPQRFITPVALVSTPQSVTGGSTTVFQLRATNSQDAGDDTDYLCKTPHMNAMFLPCSLS